MDFDKFGNVYLIDRETGKDHGPCTTVSAREILAQTDNVTVDGKQRYVTKDDWDGEVAVAPAPKEAKPAEKPAEAKEPVPVKKPVDTGGLS